MIFASRVITNLGRQFYRPLSRTYAESATAPKFSLRNADGERITSAEYFKQVAELSVEVPEADKIAVPKMALDILCTEYDALLKECADAADYQDKYRRALAETENVRRRMQRQVEDTKAFVIQGFCKDLLEVADILNIALDSLEKTSDKPDSEAGSSAHHENLRGMREGVAMTKDVLLKTFNKHGLQIIHPSGEKFDPNLHDALFEVPRDKSKHPPGHVDQVLKVGYRLHERPIRPAKVSVVKE